MDIRTVRIMKRRVLIIHVDEAGRMIVAVRWL